MTELESFLQNLKDRGTSLTIERVRLPMYTGAPVFHYRFWMCGPVWPADFAKLHRFKPELVAHLVGANRFEMSTGDTHTGKEAKQFVPTGKTKPNPLLASRAAVTHHAVSHYTAPPESLPQEALSEVRAITQNSRVIPDTPPASEEAPKRRVRLVSGKVVWL